MRGAVVVDSCIVSFADGSVYLVTVCADVAGSCVVGADGTLSGQPESFTFSPLADGLCYLICDSFGTNTGRAYDLTASIQCPVGVELRSWGRIKASYGPHGRASSGGW